MHAPSSPSLPPARTRPAAGSEASAESNSRPLPPFVAHADFSRREAAPISTDVEATAPEAAAPIIPEVAAPKVIVPDVTPPPDAPGVVIDADGTFPLDAFIIPEDARRVPAGFSASGVEENIAEGAVRKMAETLERLAMDLRRDGPAALTRQLTSTDELEARLAATLSGFANRSTS